MSLIINHVIHIIRLADLLDKMLYSLYLDDNNG
nr:MAG TPA: hypothetical protein [Caudoviricetes sp.]DAO57753.1 MAG TPA: hypothetical protein [Caudoviricetes sp.]